jgi:FSR family fosmidomycin resistance protein-like MFS transporter
MQTPPVSYFKKSLFLLWLSHLFVDFFTGIWPIYKTLAHIDIAQAGLVAGISGFLGESMQLGFGYFCDRGHRKKVLMLGLLLASSIIWITFCKTAFSSFFALLFLMLGSGSFHPAAAGMAGSLSQIYKGRTILFFASGGAIGLGISQLTFTCLLEYFEGHAYIILVPVILVLLLLSFHPFPELRIARPSVSIKNFFQPIMHCRRPLTLLYFSQVANQAIVMSFTFLLPDLLYDRGCHSWLCLGGGHFCFILGSAATMIPAGFLCDRFGHRSILLTTVAAAASLFYLFLTQNGLSFSLSALFLSCLGAFLGIINPIIVSWGNRLVPESPSTVSALLMGFAWCVGNLGPMLAGIIAKAFNNYHISMGFMGLFIVTVLVLVFLMPKESPEPVKEI